MSRRVDDITGLDIAAFEDLQVCNYGIGGHYAPHYDYARVSFFFLIFFSHLILFLIITYPGSNCIVFCDNRMERFTVTEICSGAIVLLHGYFT